MDLPQQAFLTTEQEFELVSVKSQIERMSLEQCREFALSLHKQVVIQRVLYLQLMGERIGR